MSRPTCAVVMCTYNRAHLLIRSLGCYSYQKFPHRDFEFIVVDDHSTDETHELVRDWGRDYGVKYQIITPGPKKEKWRDCGAILNCGIRATTAEYIILTHPEVMPGKNSVSECVTKLREYDEKGQPAYVCCKPYYLSPRDQELINYSPWLEDGALAVRKIPGFYDLEQQIGANPDYTPQSIEAVGTVGYRHTHWLSWVFGGCSRRTWKMMGGMLETNCWGAVDVAFMQRRRTLGIVNHTLIADDTLCVHQNHDDPSKNVPTPRNEEEWKKELAGFRLDDPQAMRYPAVDNLGWE